MSKKGIIDALKNRPCMDCHGWFEPWQMDFDHRENKRCNVAHMVRSYSLEAILSELKKCDLVCSNCHRTRTHKRKQTDTVIKKALPTKSVNRLVHTRWLTNQLASLSSL